MRRLIRKLQKSAVFLLIVFASFYSKAQSVPVGKFEAGINFGPMFFLGDLGGNHGVGTKFVKDVNLPVTKFSGGLYLNYYPAEWIGIRSALNFGNLQGADSLISDKGDDETFRKARNLHFRSPITEVYTALEISPTVFLEQYDGLFGKFRPYGVLGIGLFKFNPQALYYSPNGSQRWVDLKPLHTEGQDMKEYPQRKSYKLVQAEIPIGFGAKYYITDGMYVGLEILHRKTFTDYIDDVSTTYINPDLFDVYLSAENAEIARQVYFRGYSPTSRPLDDQRGNAKNNDSFFSSVIRFGWRITTEGSTPKQMLCPKF